MSTNLLPPNYQPPAPDHDTRQLGPLGRYTQRRYMLFHFIFTVRLIGRCLGDRRVATAAKALFVGIVGILLLALLVPEAGADMLALLAPVVGPLFDLFGVPLEGAIDWGFLVLVVGALMRLFPPEVLQQHIIELQDGRS
jgi:hypothetical protein